MIMTNIAGDCWFPVTGCLILRGNIPFCSASNRTVAYEIMEALTHWNKGQPFTCIDSTGYYCKQVDDKPEEAEDK